MDRRNGFTLVELLVALTVAAIVIAAASPGLGALLRSNKLASANNELATALQLARSEALRRGRPVTLCASATVDAASPKCAGSEDWTHGWIAFVDTRASGTPVEAPPLRVWHPIGNGIRLLGEESWLRFHPSGTVEWSGAGTASEREFLLLPDECSNDQARELRVNRLGRVRVSAVACP